MITNDNRSVNELIAHVKTLQIAKREAIRATEVTTGAGHAVGYIRVSTQKQVEEGNSLTQQEEKIKEYCRNKNLILDKTYRDEGISGGIREREGINEMLEGLVAGKKVITTSIDRIARNSEHLLNIKNKIHEKGCTMIIMDRNLDTGNEESGIIISMLASIAEAERMNTKAKISAVMQDMSKRKVLRTKPKYGWKVVEKKVVEDEEEQGVIKIIKKWLEEEPNITLTEISRRLTAQGIVIRKCSKIYPTTIKNIIESNNLRNRT